MSYQEDNGFAENFLRRDGRLNRWRYFKRCLAIGLIECVLITAIFIMTMNALGQLSTMGNILFKGVCLAGFFPYFCLATRRLHDMNKSETLAYVLVGLGAVSTLLLDGANMDEQSFLQNIVSTVSGVLGLYVLLCPGTHGDNQYGSDPLE